MASAGRRWRGRSNESTNIGTRVCCLPIAANWCHLIKKETDDIGVSESMATSSASLPLLSEKRLDARQRWISLAEFALGASIVILHNVYHRVPNEVPILFVLGWISIRVRNGGWRSGGPRKPASSLTTLLSPFSARRLS